MLHQPRAKQHAIARHPDDIALQAAKIRQKDFDSLLFALRPAFSDKFIPIGGFKAYPVVPGSSICSGCGQAAIADLRWRR